MNIAQTSGRIAAVLATVSALAALVGVAQADASTQPSTSEAAHTALQARSKALNAKYGLGSYATDSQGMTEAAHRALRLRSEALNERYGLGQQTVVSQGMTAAARSALRLRSEALNERYGAGSRGAVVIAPQPTDTTRGFAWGAFAIGVAMMLGLTLLAGGGVITLRELAPRFRTT